MPYRFWGLLDSCLAADESARTDVNIAFIDTGCAGTVLMEVGVDHAQKNPQRGIECLGIVL